MAKINLLPWRQKLRKQQQQDFLLSIGMGVIATCFIFGFVFLHIEGKKNYQKVRNQMIEDEIQIVERRIKEIDDIESKKNQLYTKIDLIQKLQESRPEIVHLFDELSKRTPEGIFLTKFKQAGSELVLTGKAQSNARVSAYMRGVEASPWLQTPVLQIIQGKGTGSSGDLSDFSMRAKQGVNKAEDQENKK